GRAFLARAVYDLAADRESIKARCKSAARKAAKDYDTLRRKLQEIARRMEAPGCAVLITTDDIRPEELAGHIRECPGPEEGPPRPQQRELDPELELDWIESRLICRR